MGHFYDVEGNPVYEVPMSTKEGMRPTTIRDARKLNLVPSVTEILNIPDKYFLRKWQAEQLLVAAWNNKKKLINEDEWKQLVLKESNKISEDSAKLGSAIHHAIDQFFKDQGMDDGHTFALYVDKAIEKIDFLWKDIDTVISEKSFYNKDGFGGKVDLHGANFILDFKTKDKEWEEGTEKSLIYDNHVMQLAAYRKGLQLPNAKCYNLFISTKKPGLVYLHEWAEEELERGWEMFTYLLQYWKLLNRMNNVF